MKLVIKISLIVLTVVTMNLVSADFVLAQEGTPPSLPVVTTPTVPTVPGTVSLPAPPRNTHPNIPLSPEVDIVITPDDLSRAHASVEACKVFRKKVYDTTNGHFKAVWPAVLAGWVTNPGGPPTRKTFPKEPGNGIECTIVPTYFEDHVDDRNEKIYGNNLAQSVSGKHVQEIVKNKGLSRLEVTKAQLMAEEERTQAGPVSKIIGAVINAILSVVASFLGLIASIAYLVLAYAIQWTTSSIMPDIVNVGWAILRDFANMFFILVMIVIGLAAILRLEKYDYRHLLGEVILMAILVNFSKVIAETIINFSNFLVLLFAVDFGRMFSFIQSVAWGNVGSFSSGGWMADMVHGLTKIVFMVVACGVFIILGGMFTIRLVGLYVLVIMSPMAYILDVLPATKKLAHDWWHKFFEYIIWAPVAMFMLKLTMLIVENDGLQKRGLGSGAPVSTLSLSNDSVFNYVILTGFLIASVLIAEHAGMVGGKAVVGGVEKAGHWLGHTAFHATDRTLASWSDSKNGAKRAMSYLSVGAWQKGREAALHHKEEESYTVAAGKRADQYNKLVNKATFGLAGKGPEDFATLAHYQRVAQEEKRFEHINDKDELAAQAKHAYHHGEYDKFMGAMNKLARQGDLNEVPLALGLDTSAASLHTIMKKIVNNTKNKNYYRLAANTVKVAEGQRDFWSAGAFVRDPNNPGEYIPLVDEDKRAEYVITQQAKDSDQSNIRNNNRRAYGVVEAIQRNAAGEEVWVSTGIASHGLTSLARTKNIGEWHKNGNQNAKATVAINISDKALSANPEVWGVAANEYVDLVMAAERDGEGSEADTVLREYRASVAAPDVEKKYATNNTVQQRQAVDFFTKIRPEIRKAVEKGEKEAVERYGKLYEYAFKKTNSATTSPATTPASPPTPPSGWSAPGGRGSHTP